VSLSYWDSFTGRTVCSNFYAISGIGAIVPACPEPRDQTRPRDWYKFNDPTFKIVLCLDPSGFSAHRSLGPPAEGNNGKG
jgi:hypothetical protein